MAGGEAQGSVQGLGSLSSLFVELVRPRASWGDTYFADTDPTGDIKRHFEGVFSDPAQEGLDGDLVTGTGMQLGEEEVRVAVLQVEFLVSLSQVPRNLTELTAFFQQVYHSKIIPADWSQSVLALLPKNQGPCVPSHLRPIALSSHWEKPSPVFCLRVLGAA